MAKKRDERGAANLLPLLAGLGLMGIGGYVWYKSTNPGGGGGNPTEETDKLIVAMNRKIDAMTLYHTQIYGEDGLRVPSEAELNSLGMMAEAMRTEEEGLVTIEKTRYRDALAHTFQDLGLFVILPIVAGFISIGGMIYWDRHKRPPSQRPPTDCPKCGASLPDADAAMAHVENSHEATTDESAIAAAASLWSNQPYWTVTTTGVMGQTWQNAYQPMTSWSLSSLSANLQGMMYSYAMGIGTVGTLQGLSTTLIYCLI